MIDEEIFTAYLVDVLIVWRRRRGKKIFAARVDCRIRANGLHAALSNLFLGAATDDKILSGAGCQGRLNARYNRSGAI